MSPHPQGAGELAPSEHLDEALVGEAGLAERFESDKLPEPIFTSATKAEIYFTASRFHDQVFGIRACIPAGTTLAPASRMTCISPTGVDQPIFPSDVMTVSAVVGDGMLTACAVSISGIQIV